MEWIEVADSAVKIGLGAVIAGVSTYLVTKASGENDRRKIKLENKLSLLQQASEDLERGFSEALDFCNSLPAFANEIEDHQDIHEEEYFDRMRAYIKGIDASLGESATYLKKAVSKMTLVGFEIEDPVLNVGVIEVFSVRDNIVQERRRYSESELRRIRLDTYNKHSQIQSQLAKYFDEI